MDKSMNMLFIAAWSADEMKLNIISFVYLCYLPPFIFILLSSHINSLGTVCLIPYLYYEIEAIC